MCWLGRDDHTRLRGITHVRAAAKYTVIERFGGTLGYDACAALEFQSGAVGCLRYSGSVAEAASTSCLEVTGSSARFLKAEGNDCLALFDEEPARTEWKLKAPGAGAWGHLQQDEHFIRCL